MTHIDRVRALLEELGQVLNELEKEAPTRRVKPRKVRKAQVHSAIVETRRRLRKAGV